jgi:hypothetical protein
MAPRRSKRSPKARRSKSAGRKRRSKSGRFRGGEGRYRAVDLSHETMSGVDQLNIKEGDEILIQSSLLDKTVSHTVDAKTLAFIKEKATTQLNVLALKNYLETRGVELTYADKMMLKRN